MSWVPLSCLFHFGDNFNHCPSGLKIPCSPPAYTSHVRELQGNHNTWLLFSVFPFKITFVCLSCVSVDCAQVLRVELRTLDLVAATFAQPFVFCFPPNFLLLPTS